MNCAMGLISQIWWYQAVDLRAAEPKRWAGNVWVVGTRAGENIRRFGECIRQAVKAGPVKNQSPFDGASGMVALLGCADAHPGQI